MDSENEEDLHVRRKQVAASVCTTDVTSENVRGDQLVRRLLGIIFLGAVCLGGRLSLPENRTDGRCLCAGVGAGHGHGGALPSQERLPGDGPHPGHRECGHEHHRRCDVHPAGALHPEHRGYLVHRDGHPDRARRRARRFLGDGLPPLLLRGDGRRLSVPVGQCGG